eukprot:CAMPEP_0176414216 /NCGR_PEP_ID=MMETSP0127-20121128/5139_1 /TAXON_ID=938130 /ORGANISM="Platyophrya macrostoma, Strain WH" /LENGTH=221 /DNA_ID=CAMNT_0017794099 /DNA_START=276 /DNA_END=942 /DNA_ORIENTATION=-
MAHGGRRWMGEPMLASGCIRLRRRGETEDFCARDEAVTVDFFSRCGGGTGGGEDTDTSTSSPFFGVARGTCLRAALATVWRYGEGRTDGLAELACCFGVCSAAFGVSSEMPAPYRCLSGVVCIVSRMWSTSVLCAGWFPASDSLLTIEGSSVVVADGVRVCVRWSTSASAPADSTATAAEAGSTAEEAATCEETKTPSSRTAPSLGARGVTLVASSVNIGA